MSGCLKAFIDDRFVAGTLYWTCWEHVLSGHIHIGFFGTAGGCGSGDGRWFADSSRGRESPSRELNVLD